MLVYRNWLGLMKGELAATFDKGGKTATRHMAPDRTYIAPDGGALTLPGRALLLVRNVGHLMTSDAVSDRRRGGARGPARRDVHLPDRAARSARLARLRNSRAGSVYIVKPKMHGPDEVAFASDIFAQCRRYRWAWRATPSKWASWTRSGAPRSISSRLHRRGQGPRLLHQYRLSRPHRRRDAHLDGGGADGAQERHEKRRVDRRL